jgi:transposase
MESTSVWEHIYNILTTLGLQVTLVNPLKARAIAEAKIKTDTVDSHILAHLLRTNLIPSVYIGTKKMRELKHLITEKIFLTKQQTQLKNRIHATLLRQGLHTTGNIFTREKQAHLHTLHIPSITRELSILTQVEHQITAINKNLRAIHKEHPQAQLLTTIPGIGYYTALALIATIGDITRFASPEKLSSYFGLVPSTHQSADTHYHGHITKQGPSTIRYLLVQCT